MDLHFFALKPCLKAYLCIEHALSMVHQSRVYLWDYTVLPIFQCILMKDHYHNQSPFFLSYCNTIPRLRASLNNDCSFSLHTPNPSLATMTPRESLSLLFIGFLQSVTLCAGNHSGNSLAEVNLCWEGKQSW